MNRNKFLPIALVVGIIVVIGIIIWQVLGGKSLFQEPWTGMEGTAVDVTLDFYESWLSERNAEEGDPFAAGLLDRVQLSKDVREHLASFEGRLNEEGVEDPVLCQTVVPPGLRTIPVYQQEESAQLIVRSSSREHFGQALVTLAAQNGLWQITEISCGNAETGPQGEYSFDKSGFLLKQVPAPLDSNYWHLVFQEAGVLGHAVPLYIDEESVCVQKDGNEVTCNDDFLKETIPARVKGELSETGVEVKRIELVDSISID
ncbi:MAG: hypothetical protein WD605_02965 [Candidatus Paceibacterota bacterium]